MSSADELMSPTSSPSPASPDNVDSHDASSSSSSSAPAAAASTPAPRDRKKAKTASSSKSAAKSADVDDDAAAEPAVTLDGQRFHVGELIYANYAEGKQWFEAKVLRLEKRSNLIYYFLHYQGWTDKYNDWRPYHNDNELAKHDDAGKKLYDDAKAKIKEGNKGSSKKSGSASASATTATAADTPTEKKKTTKRRQDDDAEEDDVSVGGAAGEVRLKISAFLKKQLIQDWESVTRQHKLVTLPRPMTVHQLLTEFESGKARQESSHLMCREVVNGLEQYFEKAIGAVLLYRFERPQYKAQVEKAALTSPPTPLSHIYGAEHLLRLFVKLPSLLSYTKLETKEAVVLGSKLNEFIRFIDGKARGGQLFQGEYEATDKSYAQEAVQTNEQSQAE